MTGLGLAVAIPAVMGYNWLTRANRVLAAKLDAFAYELHTFLSMGQPLGNGAARCSAGATCAAGSAAGRSLRSTTMAFASFDSQAARRADGRDQHGAADRRDAGAAGDLHHHRAAAHARGQARAAQGDLAGQRSEAREDRVRDRRAAARCTGTARRVARARTRSSASTPKARSGRSPRSTCAPTRAWPTASSRRRWPMRRRPG